MLPALPNGPLQDLNYVKVFDSSNTKLSFYYQNVRGLRTKLDILRSRIDLFSYDVIMFSETWLSSSVLSQELGFRNYCVFRADRSNLTSHKTNGGGVLIAISNKLSSRVLKPYITCIEHLFVMIYLGGNVQIIVGCSYIPTRDSDRYSLHTDEITLIKSKYPNAHMVIAGDYNAHDIDWNTDFHQTVPRCASEASKTLLEAFENLKLTQHNKIKNSFGNILDLMFSENHQLKVSNITSNEDSLVPLDQLYHNALCFDIPYESLTNPPNEYSFEFRNFTRANFVGMNTFFSTVDWDELTAQPLQMCIPKLYSILEEGVKRFVPICISRKSNFPSWFSPELKSLVIRKKAIHKCMKETGDLSWYPEYSNLRAECGLMSDHCYRAHINQTESNLISEPRKFWKYTKSLKTSNHLPNLMFLNEESSNTDEGISNLFAKHFSSVYSHSSNLHASIPPPFNSVINLSSVEIAESAVLSKLNSLAPKTSSGPDNIPSIVLKYCSSALAKPLCLIFNKSLSEGVFPEEWKSSYIIPIFKSGNRTQINNFRPVAKLSEIPKLFESLVCDIITPLFKQIIMPQQHGFIHGKSTATNLLSFQNYVINQMEDHVQVDTIYTDCSKAFDKVDISLLLCKLFALGVHGPFFNWLNSYLVNRTLMVKVNNELSNKFISSSGVPQGSHLGPLLFVLFVNDLNQAIDNVHFSMYADDLKIFFRVASIEDCLLVQEALNGFFQWCENNGLLLNTEKCNAISFHRSDGCIHFDYKINGLSIPRVEEIKDLGVTFDAKLSMLPHITNITSRANQMLGFIMRSTQPFSSIACLKTLYFAYVRSILEYASVVWNPHYQTQVHMIERLQHKFLRYVAYKEMIPLETLSYTDLLTNLNMQTLKDRRQTADLIFLFKLIHNQIECPDLLENIYFNVPQRSLRTNNSTFHISFHSTNYGFYSPLQRISRLGNLASESLDLFNCSLNQLRNLNTLIHPLYRI